MVSQLFSLTESSYSKLVCISFCLSGLKAGLGWAKLGSLSSGLAGCRILLSSYSQYSPQEQYTQTIHHRFILILRTLYIHPHINLELHL
jgi:hypothetical protein